MRIRRTTGADINLKLALPLVFASMGVWAIGKQGLRITMVPGWVFLWMAFDMFVRLHPPVGEASGLPAINNRR